MWDCSDSQEVGLEAATLQRVRNSSLVKRSCAENSTGLSLSPKPWVPAQAGAVGERSVRIEGRPQGRLERAEVRMPA
jgi:hypothetical protein